MGIDPNQLRFEVIRPTLLEIKLWSWAAENLLLGTAAQESKMGRYLKQVGGGPALGVFQMEPVTHDDLWQNFLRFNLPLAQDIAQLTTFAASDSEDFRRRLYAAEYPDPKEMIWNLKYAAAMCRAHYRRVKAPLPDPGDLLGMARYWKRYYNSSLGAGTVEEFVASFALTAFKG